MLYLVRMSVLGAAALVIWVSFGAASFAQAPYNIVKNFSIKANPNGVWTYLVGSETLPDKSQLFAGVPNWDAWYNGQSEPDSAVIARNKTGGVITYLTIVDPTTYLEMDPESEPDVAVRFTAPSTGTYVIKGRFLGIDTNESSHPVEVDHNGSAVFTGTMSTYGQMVPFRVTLQLAAGDTVDFANDTSASTYTNLSTGLAGTITVAP